MSSAPKLRIARLSAEVVDQALRLSYEVVNDSDLELGLLDRVPVATDVTQPPGFAPENAYLGAFDATLVVRKAILPLPPGLRASERVVPGITRLGPRASRSEDIALPLPVRAYDPHRQAQMRLGTPGAIDVVATLLRQASRVRLIIGYFEIGSARLVPLSPDYPDVSRAVPPFAPFATYGEAEAEAAATSEFEALEYEVVLEPQPPGDP